jgi:hypothetical protein
VIKNLLAAGRISETTVDILDRFHHRGFSAYEGKRLPSLPCGKYSGYLEEGLPHHVKTKLLSKISTDVTLYGKWRVLNRNLGTLTVQECKRPDGSGEPSDQTWCFAFVWIGLMVRPVEVEPRLRFLRRVTLAPGCSHAIR